MKHLPVALFLTIAVPCAITLPAGGQSHPPIASAQQNANVPAAEAAFRDGLAASERNDLRSARFNFEKAVRLAPNVAAGHAALGSVLLSLGDLSEAVRELEIANRSDHSDQSTLLNLILAYSYSHEYAKSIAAYTELKAQSEQNTALPADVGIAVATAFAGTAEAPSAQAVLQQAVAAEPDNPRLHDALGTILAQQQDFAGAATHFHQAIALDQSLAAAHYHLGAVESATGNPSEAVAEFTLAHNLEPDNLAYALDLAHAQVANNQEADAIALLRAVLAKLPPSAGSQAVEVKYRLALALQSSGNAKEALPLFTEVIATRPADAEALTNAALARVQIGDAKGGILLYLRALKLTPNNPTLREDLGVAYLQQADLDHALEQFRAGLLLDDQSPQLHYDLALALKLKDDLAAAIPEFERAAALDPQLADPPFTLGIIYMQQGNFQKSAASFEAALALNPANGEAWATLGSVYQQMQQPDKAIPALRRAIELMPAQPSPHITLAAILAAQGHKDEATAERKIGANLSRAATNRQKANFGLDSGKLLMQRGQTADALVQFQSAVEADPNYAPPHLALAEALDRSGRKAEAAEERRKAAALQPNP